MDRRGLVIFDCDGTLFPSDTATVPAVQKAFRDRGLTPPGEEDIRSFIGRPSAEFHAWLQGVCPPGTGEEIAAEVDRMELEIVEHEGQLYPGVSDMLQQLREEVEQMALCTNGRGDYVAAVLGAFGLRPYFDEVRHWESERDTKTDMVAELLDRLGARPAVVVGDRAEDIEAARANGAATIGAAYGMSSPGALSDADALARSPAELPELVLQLMQRRAMSYREAGVDLDAAASAKRSFAEALRPTDPRVLNELGPFASLFDARFPGYDRPVLALKTEEPGSKQKLALQHARVSSIAYDLIHHLVNDIAVMGAEPLAVLDTVICGQMEEDTVTELVTALGEACRRQGCSLVGGETSEQPGVLEPGTYVLSASIVGVVEKDAIIDGALIEPGDAVLAVASNGLHTNGYSLVRALLREQPGLLDRRAGAESFLEAILRPHTCYYRALRPVLNVPGLHGIAHVTGGGIRHNLSRVLPSHTAARVELGQLRVLPVFDVIRRAGGVPDEEMLRAFNLGVGLTVVVDHDAVGSVRRELEQGGCEVYPLGRIGRGNGGVEFCGELHWPQREEAG